MYDSAAYYYVSLNLHPFLIFWFCTYFNGYFHKKCIQNSADMRYYQNLILIHCCLHKQSHIIWHITQNPYLIISIFSQSLRVIGIPASSSFWRKYPYICSTFWWHSNTILVLSPFRHLFLGSVQYLLGRPRPIRQSLSDFQISNSFKKLR